MKNNNTLTELYEQVNEAKRVIQNEEERLEELYKRIDVEREKKGGI